MNDNIRILLMDDVHLEGRPPEMCDAFFKKVQETVVQLKNKGLIPIVICAGDIGEGLMGVEWVKGLDCDIIYICGNHEFWNQDYFDELDLLRQTLIKPDYKHIKFLYNDTLILHGIRFIGTTLWTNLGNSYPWKTKNWVVKYHSTLGDFKKITARKWYTTSNTQKLKDFLNKHGVSENKINDIIENKLFNPLLEIEENTTAKNYIKSELSQPFNGPSIVLTHHLPFRDPWVKTFKMKEEMLTTDVVNDERTFLESAKGNMHSSRDLLVMNFYSNDLYEEISSINMPEFWFHGHLHVPIDELVNKTRVISSPVGYLRQSSDISFKEINPAAHHIDVINFIKKDIELFPWNNEILENLRNFERTILKYEEIIRTGIVSTETFQLITQAFVQNHEHNKKEIERKTLYWLGTLYQYKNPHDKNIKIDENLKYLTGFNAFLQNQMDKRSKKIFSLSLGINHYSFLTEEKFNELNRTGNQMFHYKNWLKELQLAQLNINIYKKNLIEFLEYCSANLNDK